MRIERKRENVFTVTATTAELAALVGAARMALTAMHSAPQPPPAEVIEVLARVLSEFDAARAEMSGDAPPRG